MSNLLIALQITGLGMGLVFLAIIVLWLMMWLLTAIPLKDNQEATSSVETLVQTTSGDDTEAMTQAAAVAVAVALAEQSQSTARPLPQPPTALVSAWQLGMRSRQMYEKGGR